LVGATIAHALGLRDAPGRALSSRLQTRIGQRRLLLVIDNFEHLASAAPLLADLLETCPELRILATSRVALELRWEHVFCVPSLELPDLTPPPQLERLRQVASVAL